MLVCAVANNAVHAGETVTATRRPSTAPAAAAASGFLLHTTESRQLRHTPETGICFPKMNADTALFRSGQYESLW